MPNNLTVSSPPPYQANLAVQPSGTVTVNGATTTTFTGGSAVVMNPGFHGDRTILDADLYR